MAASINRVTLIGNLGTDPELRHTQTGSAVTTLRLATNEQWTDKDGNAQERTEWHSIVVFGKQADNCERYLQKGSSVYVEGRLQTRKWEDRDGHERTTTEIVASTVQFLSTRQGAASQDEARPGSRRAPVEDYDDADVPF